MASGRFGYDTKQHRIDKISTAWTKQAGRNDDPVDKKKGFDASNEYSNTEVYRTHRGDLELHTYNPDKTKGMHSEWWHPTGSFKIIAPGGEVMQGSTGTMNESNKQGKISTTNYASDSASYNDVRDTIGNQDGQQDLVKGGGHYRENSGHGAYYTAGMETRVQAMASGKGHYGLGKHTMNYEQGVGIGVNQQFTQQVWTRWEPDGTFHLQVKPKGAEGGNAVVKINPDGSILVTSETSMTVQTKGPITMETAQNMTIKAKQLQIKAPTTINGTGGGDALTLQGDMSQSGDFHQNGIHRDNRGHHT